MSGRPTGLPPRPVRPEDRPRATGHCLRRGCRCTHASPCDRGWLDAPDTINTETAMAYETVAPCPVCRPDAADRMAATIKGESRDA